MSFHKHETTSLIKGKLLVDFAVQKWRLPSEFPAKETRLPPDWARGIYIHARALPGLSPRDAHLVAHAHCPTWARGLHIHSSTRGILLLAHAHCPGLSPRLAFLFVHAVWNSFTHAHCPELSPQAFKSVRACALPLVGHASCTSPCARALPALSPLRFSKATLYVAWFSDGPRVLVPTPALSESEREWEWAPLDRLRIRLRSTIPR